MSYKANFVSKILRKLKGVRAQRIGQRDVKNVFSVQVSKWLAGEGRNFITMATL
jgi:hypothetical protein